MRNTTFTKVLMISATSLALAACGAKQQPADDLTAVPDPSVQSESSGVDSLDGFGYSPSVRNELEARSAGVAEGYDFVVGETDRVFFGFDSSALSKDAQMRLQEVASYLKAKDIRRVTVEGHCDERGTREYNLALGDRRAVAAKKYLVGLGVDESRITTISFGKERPANAAHNEGAWSENRRAVVVVVE